MNWTPVEGSVLTADLCAIYGCDKCPCHLKVRELPIPAGMKDTGTAPLDPDDTVLCRHSCHRISEEELAAEEQGTSGEESGITVVCPKCGYTTVIAGGFATVDVFVCTGCGEMVRPGIQ